MIPTPSFLRNENWLHLMGQRVAKYSPSQPRDERGRWTSSGHSRPGHTSWLIADAVATPAVGDTRPSDDDVIAKAMRADAEALYAEHGADLAQSAAEVAAFVDGENGAYPEVGELPTDPDGVKALYAEAAMRLQDQWGSQTNTGLGLNIQDAAQYELGRSDSMGLDSLPAAISGDGYETSAYLSDDSFISEWVRTHYDRTQARLASIGVTGVTTVYRGVQMSDSFVEDMWGSLDDANLIQTRPLSSTSLDRSQAEWFAQNGDMFWGGAMEGEEPLRGYVTSMDVPVEDIFDVGEFGFPSLAEVIVLGGWYEGVVNQPRVRKYSASQPRDSRGRWTSGGGNLAHDSFTLNTEYGVGGIDDTLDSQVRDTLKQMSDSIAMAHDNAPNAQVQVIVPEQMAELGMSPDTRGFYMPNAPGFLSVSAGAPNPGATLVHEYAHMLQAEYLPDDSTGPVLDVLRSAGGYTHQLDADALMPELAAGAAHFKAYIQSDPELFARGYMQWVALKSGHTELMNDVTNNIGIGQWSWDEFDPIADEFDYLFNEVSLIRKFNPHHDERGRFASAPGGTGFTTMGDTQRAAVDRETARRMEKIAERAGVPADELQPALEEALAEFAAKAEVGIVMSRANASKVANGGRYEAFTERRDSSTHADMNIRREVESDYFGIGMDTPDSERPVYGFLSTDGTHPRGAEAYGDYTVWLKPDVKARTTFTFGDTGGGTQSIPSRVSKPGLESVLPAMSGNTVRNGMARGASLKEAAAAEVASALSQSWYAEAQVHVSGGLGADSVDRIVDHRYGDRMQITKFNPYHDERGRFTTRQNGGGSMVRPFEDGNDGVMEHLDQIEQGVADRMSKQPRPAEPGAHVVVPPEALAAKVNVSVGAYGPSIITQGQHASVNEGLNEAFVAISKTHDLPEDMGLRINVLDDVEMANMGAPEAEGVYAPTIPGELFMKASSSTVSSTFVHEFGHLVDHEVLMQDRGGVMAAMRSVDATYGIADRFPNRDQRESIMRYLDDDREMFARGYTQWVGTRSGDARILSDTQLEAGLGHWRQEDFGPIADAFDAMFADKGLSREVAKFNPHHDPANGRFTTGPGGGWNSGHKVGETPTGAKNADVRSRMSEPRQVSHSEGEVPQEQRPLFPGQRRETTVYEGEYQTKFGVSVPLRAEVTHYPHSEKWGQRSLTHVEVFAGEPGSGPLVSRPENGTDGGHQGYMRASGYGSVEWGGKDFTVPTFADGKRAEIGWIEVDDSMRRRGIGTAMVEFGRDVMPMPIEHSTSLSELGEQFVQVVKYSPSQPRDDRGRWTDGAVAHHFDAERGVTVFQRGADGVSVAYNPDDLGGLNQHSAPEALATVERVHARIQSAMGNVEAPPVEVEYVPGYRMAEVGPGTVGYYRPAVKGRITVKEHPSTEYFMTHEYAHFLDWEKYGKAGIAATARAGKLTDIVAAIRVSPEYRQWKYEAHAAYWANDQETFARAFTQYVVSHSSDGGLDDAFGEEMGVHWSKENFGPIAAEFDKLFDKG